MKSRRRIRVAFAVAAVGLAACGQPSTTFVPPDPGCGMQQFTATGSVTGRTLNVVIAAAPFGGTWTMALVNDVRGARLDGVAPLSGGKQNGLLEVSLFLPLEDGGTDPDGGDSDAGAPWWVHGDGSFLLVATFASRGQTCTHDRLFQFAVSAGRATIN